jgi:2-iminobutanoate/2-iminopropanoate deaminase
MAKVIATEGAPAAIGPYSQAIAHGGVLYASGQIGLDPATGVLVEGGIEAETRRALENLAAVLEAAGAGLHSVLKTTVYLADLNDYAAMNAIYAELFGETRPARAAVEVARLPRDARVEIDCVAAI